MNIPSGIISAPVERDENEVDHLIDVNFPVLLRSDLVLRLCELHPEFRNMWRPTPVFARSAIDFLCGHYVRWIYPTRQVGGAHSLIYKNPAPIPFPDADRLLMVCILNYSGHDETEQMCRERFLSLPAIRVVLGNGYTLVIRLGVGRGISFGADATSCFASLVATTLDEVSDTDSAGHFTGSDVEISIRDETLVLRVFTRSIAVPMQTFMHSIFTRDRSFYLNSMRILEQMFPILRK